MLKAESVAPLRNATLAQNDALSAVAERVANQSPFFECDVHVCEHKVRSIQNAIQLRVASSSPDSGRRKGTRGTQRG